MRTITILLLCSLALASCGGVNCKDPAHASDAVCVAQRVVADCTGVDIQGSITQWGPAILDAIGKARKPDGSIDASSLETVALQYGGCAVSEVFSKLIFSKLAVAGSGAGAPPAIDPATAKTTYESLRAKMWPSATFKTSGGTL